MSKRSRKKRRRQEGAEPDVASTAGSVPPAVGDGAPIGALFARLRSERAPFPSVFPHQVIERLSGRPHPQEKSEAPADRHSAPAGPTTAWLRQRVESLDAALEVAGERLQRSLRRQGELEAQAQGDRVRAEHLSDADERAARLAREIETAIADASEATVRARSLAAEKEHLEAELSRLERTLAEREKTLATLAAEAGRERLLLLEKLEAVASVLAEAQRAQAQAEGQSAAYREENERLSGHLTLREKTLADAARQSASERERFLAELAALQEKIEAQAAEAGRRERELREELAHSRSEEQLHAQGEERLGASLEAERERTGSLERRLGEQAERVRDLGEAHAKAQREAQGLRAELGRLSEEREGLSRIVTEREQTLREELTAARAEREQQRAAIADSGARYEQLVREHERLSQWTIQLEADQESLTQTATQEKDRARKLAAEVVGLEDRLREMTAQLERARRGTGASEHAAIEAELSRERERLSEELARLRGEGEELAEHLRRAQHEAAQAHAARTALEERAEVAEALVRERLRGPAPSPPEPARPADSPQVEQRLGSLEGHTRQIEQGLARLQEALSRPPEPGAAPQREAQEGELSALRQEIALLAQSAQEGPGAGRPAPVGTTRRRELTLLAAALAALVILAGALAAIYGGLKHELAQSQEATKALIAQASTLARPAEPLPLPRLTSPSAGSTVRRARADLEGEAPGAEAVFLFLNENLFAVTIARQGRFAFEQVPLEPGKTKLALRAIESSGRASDLWETILLRPGEPGELTPPAVRDFLRGPRRSRMISLTFDGDTSNGASAVLDVLRDQGIETTVFLTGKFVEESPDLTRRIVAEGHEVGNHTWDHPHLTTFDETSRHDTRPEVSKAFFQGQLIRTASRFEELTGKQMVPFWRAPFGEVNTELMRWAEEIGYQHVNWTRDYGRGETLDSLDWVSDPDAHNYYTSNEIAERLLSFGQGTQAEANGGIVLMHLGTRRSMGQALSGRLPAVIAGWRDRGYRFVKVSQMIKTNERG